MSSTVLTRRVSVSGTVEKSTISRKLFDVDLKNTSSFFQFRFVSAAISAERDIEEPVAVYCNLHAGKYGHVYEYNNERQTEAYGEIPTELVKVSKGFKVCELSKEWLPVRNPEDFIVLTFKGCVSGMELAIENVCVLVDFRQVKGKKALETGMWRAPKDREGRKGAEKGPKRGRKGAHLGPEGPI